MNYDNYVDIVFKQHLLNKSCYKLVSKTRAEDLIVESLDEFFNKCLTPALEAKQLVKTITNSWKDTYNIMNVLQGHTPFQNSIKNKKKEPQFHAD